jgi:TRAP-type C4-dicarboxylate transport system substrate-binding protein
MLFQWASATYNLHTKNKQVKTLEDLKGMKIIGWSPYELNVVNPYMDKHPTIVNGFMPWLAEMEEKSGGRLKFNYYNPNTLVPDKDVYDSTISGMVDFGLSYVAYAPGRFPLNSVMELPLIAPSAEAGSLVTTVSSVFSAPPCSSAGF